MAIEDVVAQHQHTRRSAHKVAAEYECLRKAVRAWLYTVAETYAPLTAVSQQTLESRSVLRRTYQQNVSYPRGHQCAQRVIHQRLIVDGEQLLADRERGGMQASSASAGKN